MFEHENRKKYTTTPTTVGSSIIGIKYDKGVVIATDKRITSYGYKKYNDISRIAKINNNTIIGSSGEFSDFQELTRLLTEKAEDDQLYNGYDSFLGPKEFSSYLAFISYQKRNKMNPYWNTTIVGGFDWDGKPYMNSVDQYGTIYNNCFLFSGFATYFAGPILEHAVPKDHTKITKERAIELIDEVFKVLFYRDANAGDRLYYGIIEKSDDESIPRYDLQEKKLQTNWEHDLFKKNHNDVYHPTA
jgi:20S proteasome subunit beta 7